MSRAATAIAATAALVFATLPPSGASAAPQALVQPEPRPVAGTSAAIAGADAPVVAWLQDEADHWRVFARAGDATMSVRLGPEGPGDDGAPVSARTDDGMVWVLASRTTGEMQRLWLQGYRDGAWSAPLPGPAARRDDHHPAVAAVPGSDDLWAVWIGEDDTAAGLWASHWNGTAWSAAEALPRPLGAPMAPAITIADGGLPTVIWAANDGGDAEIWASTRRAGRWSAPLPLSRNDVPDINPSIAATAQGLLATWISYTDEGYLPVAATAARADEWSAPQALSAVPGGRPLARAVDGRPVVFWRRLEEEAGGGTIVARMRVGAAWDAPLEVAAAAGSPFDVRAAADGRLMLAFARPDGRLGVVAGEPGADRIGALAAASAARYGPLPVRAPGLSAQAQPAPAAVLLVPQNYTAFGDSITNGVVYDPDRRDSAGYRGPLQDMLRAFFRFGTVFNAGVDGEPTSDGVGRIDNAISAQNPQVILIMEGTNDILSAIDVDVIVFNLRRMVQRSYEEKPDIKPFLAQLPPRLDPGPEGFNGPGNGRIDEVNAALIEVGQEERAVIVDMNTPIDGHYELMSNHVHPSIAGYEVMAVQWYDAIRPVVLADTNRGDLDDSGRTDGIDLVQLALAFGSIEGEDRYTTAADINGDGIVDGFDLDMLVEFFGQDVSDGLEGGS